MERNCNNCVHALMVDFGYSNWTVEGTEFHCMKKLHPDGSFDRFYGSDDKLDFAQECPEYSEGDPQSLDVDREEEAGLNEEAREYLELGPVENPRWS